MKTKKTKKSTLTLDVFVEVVLYAPNPDGERAHAANGRDEQREHRLPRQRIAQVDLTNHRSNHREERKDDGLQEMATPHITSAPTPYVSDHTARQAPTPCVGDHTARQEQHNMSATTQH